MPVALFDLDNTLLDGDSDYEWGRFLVNHGVVAREWYERENRRFFEDYESGRLDIHAYARFAYRPLAETPLPGLKALRADFVEECILPIILPAARVLLDRHREWHHVLAIVTSTNRFVTEPIAEMLGVDHLLASEPECNDQGYTGELSGTPCFREGKIHHVRQWMEGQGLDLDDSWFYSDSHNDLPLLETVTHPVAVDADATLATLARERGWPRISLRNPDLETLAARIQSLHDSTRHE